jgi:protein gp37
LKWNEIAGETRAIDGEILRCWGTVETVGKPETFRIVAYPSHLKAREHDAGDRREITKEAWNSAPQPRPCVFCGSLCDWLDDEVPIEWTRDMLDVVRVTGNLDWLLLTKRPEKWSQRICDVMDLIESEVTWEDALPHDPSCQLRNWLADWEVLHKPPSNIWVGTTVENQEMADQRIPALLQIPAKVRFLSCEPLLGVINLIRALPICLDCNGDGEITDESNPLHWKNTGDGEGEDWCPTCTDAGQRIKLPGLDWVICGGESGPKARPMHPDWARSLRDQCAAAGVPFFFKQWGGWGPDAPDDDKRAARVCKWITPTGDAVENGNPAEDEPMFRVGKKVAGRLLDGVEHNEFPESEVQP